MRFNFHITLNDNDYINYNMFWATKSTYGKKQMLSLRIMMAILFVFTSFFSLYGGGFSATAWIGIIPYIVMFVLFQLLMNYFFTLILKSHVKSLKSKGKMGYSPVSDMEFYDESFIETTPENKSEQKYSAVERISVVTDKVIYIHINNVMAYILPIYCFESKEQYADFIEFIKTKCKNIDVY